MCAYLTARSNISFTVMIYHSQETFEVVLVAYIALSCHFRNSNVLRFQYLDWVIPLKYASWVLIFLEKILHRFQLHNFPLTVTLGDAI